MSAVIVRVFFLLPLLVAMWSGACEARAFFGLDSLFSGFDPTGISNGTSLLEQFFSSHAQHSLGSLAELLGIGDTFFQGK